MVKRTRSMLWSCGGINSLRTTLNKKSDETKMAIDDKPYTPEGKDFYMTDAFSSNAVKLIDEYGRKPNPYLLYLAYDTYPGVYLWDSLQAKSVLLFTPEHLNLRNPSWSQDNHYIIYAPQTTVEINSILRLDVNACLRERKDCTPQPLTHVIGIYDTPRWRPRSS